MVFTCALFIWINVNFVIHIFQFSYYINVDRNTCAYVYLSRCVYDVWNAHAQHISAEMARRTSPPHSILFCSFLPFFELGRWNFCFFCCICTQSKTFSFVLLRSFCFLLLGFIQRAIIIHLLIINLSYVINDRVLCIENKLMMAFRWMYYIFGCVLYCLKQENKREKKKLLNFFGLLKGSAKFIKGSMAYIVRQTKVRECLVWNKTIMLICLLSFYWFIIRYDVCIVMCVTRVCLRR